VISLADFETILAQRNLWPPPSSLEANMKVNLSGKTTLRELLLSMFDSNLKFNLIGFA
jgi:hypothetical protein